MAAPAQTVAFRPKQPFRMPWEGIVVGIAAAFGLGLALAGVLVALGAPPAQLAAWPRSRGMDLLAVAFLVGVAPPAYFSWLHRRRLLKLDERLPDFLTDLGALHKAGLTLQDSLVTTAGGDYGPLTREVRMAADQVRWNVPVLTALDNLRRRIGTPIAARTLTVVLEAGRTGGNLPEVIEIAAGNARSFIALRDSRRRSMGLYTIIIYVASLVFIGVALALQSIFVPKMIEAFGMTGGSGLPLANGMPTADEFRGLFYSAALVQAVGNGLVGGLMSEGRALAGLRHAWFLVLLTLLGFLVS